MFESLHSYVEELLYAARAGFDGVAVSEHSQSIYYTSPNPNLAAAIVAHTAALEGLDTAICVIGRSLGEARAAEDRGGVRSARYAQRRAADRGTAGRVELRRQPERRDPSDRDALTLPRGSSAAPKGMVGDGAVRLER
jgi:hypothetical protein